VPYNDLAAAKKLFAKYKGKLACFVVEPVPEHGRHPPAPGYLEGLRDYALRMARSSSSTK